jgi:protease-4
LAGKPIHQTMRLIGRIFLYLLAGVGGLTALLVTGLAVFAFFLQDEPAAPNKIVLSIEIGRGVVERQERGFLQGFGKKRGLVLRRAIDAIDTASGDERVKGIVLNLDGKLSIAHAQALRRAISAFRKSGKFVHAYAKDFGGNSTVAYYLASVSEKIWMQPSGTLGLIGLAIESPFFAPALEKLDVKAHYEQRHEYKGAGEQFVRSGFSPEARDSLQSLIDVWMAQITGDIAFERQMSVNEVSTLMDTGPLLAVEAKTARLIDLLAYRDEFDKKIGKLSGKDSEWLSVEGYLAFRPFQISAESKVALIYGEGAIVPGRDSGSQLGKSQKFAADSVTDAILDAAEDPTIAAIVLRIDSPGGAYGASDTVWRAVNVAKEKGKPVVASLGRTAASGGYFVAMAADKIVAEAGTVTGSIGVLTLKFVTRDFWRKLGVEWDRVQSGPRAAIWSMIDEYPSGGAKRVSALLDAVYADFTGKVASARGLDANQIDAVARGRIWTGAGAKEVGLVDEIGGLGVAFGEIRKLLKLKTEEPLEIVEFPKPSRLEEVLNVLRQQGFEVDAALADIRSLVTPAYSVVLKSMADHLQIITPPIGVLQMPAWQMAR